MKKTIGFSIFIVLVSIFACNRDFDEATNEAFTPTGVEAWFNSTFKSSKEWQQNADSHNKQPDWSNGVYLEKDGLEILEFPLVENKATITVPVDATTTNQITKKILDATLSRMLIIKTSTNEMVVRKLYYVPDYKYLLSKGYDISECMLYKTHDDFTGLLITKNWNDEVLSYHKVKNGKIEGILRKYDATAAKSNSLKQINMNSYTSAKTSGLDSETNLNEVVIINNYHRPTTYTYVYYTQPYYQYISPTNTYNPYDIGFGGGGSITPPPPPTTTPCDQIKNVMNYNPNDPNSLKSSLNWLKDKVNAPVNDKEFGVEIRKKMNYDESYRYEFTQIASENEFQSLYQQITTM